MNPLTVELIVFFSNDDDDDDDDDYIDDDDDDDDYDGDDDEDNNDYDCDGDYDGDDDDDDDGNDDDDENDADDDGDDDGDDDHDNDDHHDDDDDYVMMMFTMLLLMIMIMAMIMMVMMVMIIMMDDLTNWYPSVVHVNDKSTLFARSRRAVATGRRRADRRKPLFRPRMRPEHVHADTPAPSLWQPWRLGRVPRCGRVPACEPRQLRSRDGRVAGDFSLVGDHNTVWRYVTCESRSSLDCIEEVVLGKLKCQVARPSTRDRKNPDSSPLESGFFDMKVRRNWEKLLSSYCSLIDHSGVVVNI